MTLSKKIITNFSLVLNSALFDMQHAYIEQGLNLSYFDDVKRRQLKQRNREKNVSRRTPNPILCSKCGVLEVHTKPLASY